MMMSSSEDAVDTVLQHVRESMLAGNQLMGGMFIPCKDHTEVVDRLSAESLSNGQRAERLRSAALHDIAARMKKRELARALDGWSALHKRKQHLKLTSTRAIGRMLHMRAGRVFLRWLERTSEAKILKHTAGRVVRRLQRGAKAAAFSSWFCILQAAREQASREDDEAEFQAQLAQQRADRATEVEAQSRLKVRVAIGRQLHRSLAGSFSGWLKQLGQSKKLRLSATRVAARMLHRSNSEAFQAWRNSTAEINRLYRVSYVRVIARLTRAENARAFSRWVEYRTQRRLSKLVGRRLKTLLVGRALSQWVEFTRKAKVANMEAAHQQALDEMRQATHAQQQRQEAVAMVAREQQARWMVGRLMQKTVHRVLAAWHQHCRASMHLQATATRVFGRLTHHAVARALAAWQANVNRRMQLTAYATKTITRLLNRSISRGFDGWVEYTLFRRLVRRVSSRLTNLSLGRSFGQWIITRCVLAVACFLAATSTAVANTHT